MKGNRTRNAKAICNLRKFWLYIMKFKHNTRDVRLERFRTCTYIIIDFGRVFPCNLKNLHTNYRYVAHTFTYLRDIRMVYEKIPCLSRGLSWRTLFGKIRTFCWNSRKNHSMGTTSLEAEGFSCVVNSCVAFVSYWNCSIVFDAKWSVVWKLWWLLTEVECLNTMFRFGVAWKFICTVWFLWSYYFNVVFDIVILK